MALLRVMLESFRPTLYRVAPSLAQWRGDVAGDHGARAGQALAGEPACGAITAAATPLR